VVQVIEPRAIVDTVARHREPTADELVKKRVALLAAMGNAGEGGVLPLDAQPGMAHHEHEKPRLALGEAVVDDRLHAFGRRQSQSSSAMPR